MAKSTRLKAIKTREVRVGLVGGYSTRSATWIEEPTEIRIVKSSPTAIKVLKRDDQTLLSLNRRLRGDAGQYADRTQSVGDESAD